MKNKLILFFFWMILSLSILFFLILIISIFIQAGTSISIKQVLKREVFFAIKLSFITAFLASNLAILVSIPIAFILSRNRFPLKNLIETILFLPIVAPPIALGAMLLIFFKTSIGEFFERNFFSVVYEIPGLVFAQGIVAFGIAVNVIKVVFDSVSPEYEEISRTLGATKTDTFFRIILPLSKKGIASAFFLAFARAIGEFGASVMLAGATPMKTETLPIAIFLNFSSGNVKGACLFILISIVISLGTLFLIRRMKINDKSRKTILPSG